MALLVASDSAARPEIDEMRSLARETVHRFIGVAVPDFLGGEPLNVEASIRTTEQKRGHGALALIAAAQRLDPRQFYRAIAEPAGRDASTNYRGRCKLLVGHFVY